MKFTCPPSKSYKKDIEIVYSSIKNRENITISKFCDGEWAILSNKNIDNNEFNFNPYNSADIEARKMLLESFQFQHEQYFVGITCVNVFGIKTHRQMKMISGQPESKLTWADIWVNSNYKYYVDNFIPLFRERNTILVCNENGHLDNLPFNPSKVYTVKDNALKKSRHIIDEIKKDIGKSTVRGHIFLFCCGPFGNVLCHQLTKHNPHNTYLDIGSTLNPYLKSEGFKRDYYTGTNFFSQLIGKWDNGRCDNYPQCI